MPSPAAAAPYRTARERARAEVMTEILGAARRQIATEGAAALSLRAVARDVGMVSSGIYRYVASRDELLTLLIVEAYDSLGAAAEGAATMSARSSPADRFVAVGTAIRTWALAHRHEFALIYGSPVPGYAAPETTIVPASRVTSALVGVLADAARAGVLQQPAVPRGLTTEALLADLDTLREFVGALVSDEALVAMIAAWTQLFGLISFELFGQTHNVIHAHTDLFTATVAAMAAVVGLP